MTAAGGDSAGDVGDRYEAFLRGERPDDVLFYLHEGTVASTDELLEIGLRVDDGVVLVLPAEQGRGAFERATGVDAMDFAGTAMQRDGDVDRDCTGGRCPEEADAPDDHHPTFVFAFAEEQNETVGDIYAEGDVVHAYVSCSCGTAYSDRWVAGA